MLRPGIEKHFALLSLQKLEIAAVIMPNPCYIFIYIGNAADRNGGIPPEFCAVG